MNYLLDTNACVEYLRQRNAKIVQRIAASDPNDLRTCSVVKAELYFGALRSQQSAANLAKVDAFVGQFISLPFDDQAAGIQAKIWADLAAAGNLIGPFDMLIAAIALAHGLTLVTHNTAEFSRVSELLLEDWQA